MRLKSAIASALLGLLVLEPGGATAGDLPIRWGGAPVPNMVSSARKLPADLGTAKTLWDIKLGTHQYSIPTLDRGRIYLGINDAGMARAGFKATQGGVVACVDQATGNLIWQMPTPRFFGGVIPPYHFDQWKCGICSGPVVDGERVYVISGRGEILCLDRNGQANGNDGPFLDEPAYMGLTNNPGGTLAATDGDILWKYELIKELDVVPHDVCGSTLLIVGDLLFACTSNGIDDRHNRNPRPQAPTLIALDKKTGRLVARDAAGIGERMLHCNWGSPLAAVVDGQPRIYFGAGDGWLYAFELPSSTTGPVQTLKQLWAHDCNPPHYRVRDGQPVPYSKHNLNRPDGPSEIIGTPAYCEGRLYVVIGQSPLHGNGQGCLSCVDAVTGKQVWASELVDRSLATPAIAEGLLYLPDTTGNLHCFDSRSGERLWVQELGSKAWCASAFVADGKVYAGTEGGDLWVLQASREKKVLSRTRLKSAPATPIAADGVLYVPTQRGLTAYSQ
jgi:outer membrane protein assembly factor BamB